MKLVKWSIVTCAIALVVIINTQCKHEPLKKLTGTDTTTHTVTPEDTTICFERDILPLFISNCATSGCHDATSHVEGLNLTTYTKIMRGIVAGKPANSAFYNAISTGYMPPYSAMPAAQLALIKRWILQGAKNGTNCPSKCDSTNFKLSTGIQPMLNTYCVGCHTTANPGGGVSLDNYSGIQQVGTNGKLWGSINGLTGYSFMPKGGAALNDCQKTQIKKWIAAGCPNN